MKKYLQYVGKNGPVVVISGVILGIGVPALCDVARPYLYIAIFIFTFGSFLKLEKTSLGSEMTHMTRNILMVFWATFGVPGIVAIGIASLNPAVISHRGSCSGPWFRRARLAWPLHPCCD